MASKWPDENFWNKKKEKNLTKPWETPETVKSEASEQIDSLYSETSLGTIWVYLKEAKKLSSDLWIDNKTDLEKFQKEHNLKPDGKIGIETYLEMQARHLYDEFEKNPENKKLQEKVLTLIEYWNIWWSNFKYFSLKIRNFKLAHREEWKNIWDKYYDFFKKIDEIAEKKYKKENEKVVKMWKKQWLELNEVLWEWGLLSVIKWEKDGKPYSTTDYMKDLKDTVKDAAPELKWIIFAMLFFSVIFGVPKSVYNNVPGMSSWYTRIPLALSFLTLGWWDLLWAWFEKLEKEIFKETPPKDTTEKIKELTWNKDASETSKKISKVTDKIFNENWKLATEKIDTSKLFKLNNELLKNENLLNRKLDDKQINITTLWITEFCNKNKISEKELQKYIKLLKLQSKPWDTYFYNIFKTKDNEVSTETSQDSTETTTPKPNSWETSNTSPEIIETTTNELMTWLNFRIDKFKKIAQKTEDLENSLWIAWNEEENINKYKKELNNGYSQILLIISNLKNKLINNSNTTEINKIKNKLNDTYLFLSKYFAWWNDNLDNDHLRDYKISSFMAIWVLFNKWLIDSQIYPDLNENSLRNNPDKFEIDLEKLLDELENNNDIEVQKALSILEDNNWIGWFDFEEDTTDGIYNTAGWVVAWIWATAWIIMTAPGWIVWWAIAGTAVLVWASINTVSRWESDLWKFAWEVWITAFQSLWVWKVALWSAKAVSESTSLLATTWIISTEVVADVVWIWMTWDYMKSFVYDYDYNLWKSFEENIIWAPLTLLWGWWKWFRNVLERAKIKRAIWDTKWAIEEIKIFNKEISNIKTELIWKKFNIEIDWKKFEVKISNDWKFITKENDVVRTLDWTKKEDKKIINKLVKEIHQKGILKQETKTKEPFKLNLKTNKFDKEFKNVFEKHDFTNELILKWDNFSIKVSKIKEGKYSLNKIDSEWKVIEEVLKLANQRKILKEINKIDPELKSKLVIKDSVENISKLKRWQSFGPKLNFIFWDKKFQILEEWKLSIYNKETWKFELLEWEKLNKYLKQNPKIIDKIKNEYLLSEWDKIIKSAEFWAKIKKIYSVLPKNMKHSFISSIESISKSIKDGSLKTASWFWNFTKDLTCNWFGKWWPALSWKWIWIWWAVATSYDELIELANWEIDLNDWAAIAELLYKFTLYSKLWLIRWAVWDSLVNYIFDKISNIIE